MELKEDDRPIAYKCTVCGEEKIPEMELVKNGRVWPLCRNSCIQAFKFVHGIGETGLCDDITFLTKYLIL